MPADGNTLYSFLPLILMFGVFYLFLIRPQKKREKQEAAMRNSVDVGDTITTIGGIVGRVVNVKEDDILVVEIGADRTKLMIRRWAVRSKDTLSE